MSRPCMTDALYDKVQEFLYPHGAPTSQSGMTRTELRLLERRGVVKKSYVKSDPGVIECFWRLA